MSRNLSEIKGKGREASAAADADARSDAGSSSAGESAGGGDSSFDEADDQDWADWVDDDDGQQGAGGQLSYGAPAGSSSSSSSKNPNGAPPSTGFKVPTLALFPSSQGSKQLETFPDADTALAHAASLGCDLMEVVQTLQLDALQVIRLLNHLRRSPGALAPADVAALTGGEPFLSDDAELRPVPGAENDGLLQIDFDELVAARGAQPGAAAGRGGAGPAAAAHGTAPAAPASAAALHKRVEELEQQLLATQMAYAELQKRSLAHLLAESGEASGSGAASGPSSGAATATAAKTSGAAASAGAGGAAPGKRDDDTHYFESYASNDIHQVMISDTARTLSYARFILSPANAHLFRGKRVMDVGCGSGILSLFAARAGAAHVVAIDASDVAQRAQANVRENKLDHVVKVVKGKVEDLREELRQYEGKIDVIISEWMGYFLLYESMLPSVLHARDLYLRRETSAENPHPGLLAPSHCRMTFAAVSDAELLHERIHFWNGVHGFKMTAMTKGLTDEAYTECLKPEAVVTDVADIYDLPLCILPPKQPTFRSPFRLTCQKSAVVHGFVSWFDTWFMTSPEPYDVDAATGAPRQMQGGERLDALPPCTTDVITLDDVPALKLKGADIAPEQPELAGKGEVVSFTTGPYGKDTHWKQTVFLLKEPIDAQKGATISGEIIVTQCESNSRELEVELHYLLEEPSVAGARKKSVKPRLVQLFKVR